MFDPVKAIIGAIANDPNVSPSFAKAMRDNSEELDQCHGGAQAFAFWHKVRTVVFLDDGKPEWMTREQFDCAGYDVEPLSEYDTDGHACW